MPPTGGKKAKKEEPATLKDAAAVLKAADKKTGGKKYHAVDYVCPIKSTASVVVVDDYDCMLNQTNIEHNENKFYVIQVLQQGFSYYCWTRWGRVGQNGSNALKESDLDGAIKDFEKKFKDKTRNAWASRATFTPMAGKYTLIEMADEDEVDAGPSVVAPSTSGQKVNKIDTKKMPLGKLSKGQIAKGFEVLDEIEKELDANIQTKINELSSRFYTVIPHSFGHNIPPPLNTVEKMRERMEMLMVLGDIEIAQSLQKEKDKKMEVKSLSGSENNSSYKSSDDIKDMETSPPSIQKTEYVSRFTSEFEHIRILGEGGFGVVFEVMNKVDECHYAVKRIAFSNRDGTTKKVKREAQALAKLDHVGIVRYFYSWIESPPTGWQEDKDREIGIEQSECISSPTQLDSTTNNKSSPESSNNSLGSSPPKVINIPTQKKASLFDNLQTPFGVNNLDNLESSHSDGDLINRGGSEELSDSESELSRSGRVGQVDDEQDDNSGLFSCAVGTSYLSTFQNDSSIEFKRSNSVGEESRIEYSKSQSDMNKKSVEDSSTSKSSFPGPKHYLYIQMQLCKPECLKDWLSSNRLKRDRHTVIGIFEQIVCAIEYVHECGLMHRDLKPSNLFFSLDGVVKIGDFGLVTALPEEQNANYDGVGNLYKHTSQVGTKLYMSPEQISGKVYSKKVDIFSLGLILFELLYTFATDMERNEKLEDVKQQIFPDKCTSEMAEEWCELIRLMLSEDPDTRPTACMTREKVMSMKK